MPSFEAMAFRKFWGQFLNFVRVSGKFLRQADPMLKYPLAKIRMDVCFYPPLFWLFHSLAKLKPHF